MRAGLLHGPPYLVCCGDFDCQGMSIGVAQWNVGKSYVAVKQIVMSVPETERRALMPLHGDSFIAALSRDKQATMTYVRSLQMFADPRSCDAIVRKARWSNDGNVFVRELSRLLLTPQSQASQRQQRAAIFNDGKNHAARWTRALRGPGSDPTLKEIAYFVDMQNFNGGGLQKFGVPYAGLDAAQRQACPGAAIGYLRQADDAFLLHKKAARKNSVLLQPAVLSDSDRDLFCIAHRVALKLNARQARQFRLTTINRLSAILYGQAYYGDRDTHPTKISFPPP